MPKGEECMMCGKIRKVGERYRTDENGEMVHDDCVSLEFLVDSGVDPKSAADVWTKDDYRRERADYGGWYFESFRSWVGFALHHRRSESLRILTGRFGFVYYFGE